MDVGMDHLKFQPMRLPKFLVLCFALLIGMTYAFRKHAYRSAGDYPVSIDLVSTAPLLADKVHQESDSPLISNGKKLFKSNCASCHNRNMRDEMTGPALAGVRSRWEGRETLLYDWIRNSANLIADKDAYALALFEKWDRTAMTAFPNLSDEEIEAMLAYIDYAGGS